MVEEGKEHGFWDMIKDGLIDVSHIISGSIFPSIAEGTDMVMKNIEERIIRLEKRLLRELSSLMIIGFGAIFLIFALFFFLKEYLGWGNALAFFSIGIIIFVIGLLLKIRGSDR